MRKKFAFNTLKLIILITILLLSVVNFKATLDQSISENGELIFIKEKPAEDYVFKKFVYISGAITNPGVYEVTNDLRLVELIEIAGGLTQEADIEIINKEFNLSTIIKDSDHIFIPNKNPFESDSSPNSTKININTASLDQLDTLPGIGESTAKKIIASRPFNSIEDLKNVSGIGDSKFDQIKDLITAN